MSGRARRRRPRSRLVGSSPGLLPRVLAAFLVVLAVSVAVTIALETRLVRAELSEQTRLLSAEQGLVLERLLREEQLRTSQSVETLAQVARVSGRDHHVELLELLRTVRVSNSLELGDVVDVATGQVVVSSTSRHRIADLAPSAEVETGHVTGQRVVPLERDDGFALVYVSSLSRLGPEQLAMAVGYPLDDRRAERLRAAAGAEQVEVVVDGEVVASTSPGSTDPAGRWRRHGEIQEATDPEQLVRYVGLAASDEVGHEAAVGLVLEDPLAPLDAGLIRTRVLMGVLLVVLCGLLALAVARRMTRPLQELSDTATSIAGGELEASFHAERSDEIGTLATALERMRVALRSQLLLIRRQADALRTAARRIVGAQDAERRRLAQDLHDGIQQQLVLLRLQVSLARTRLLEDPDRLDEEAGELSQRIDQLLDELRATGQALFPAILRDRGLGGALFSLAARSTVPIHVDLHPDPLPRVDPEVETGAYFLISEAVTNALKHARAEHVGIRVRHGDDALRVVVDDDGVGFDTARVQASGGLLRMRDRVDALGGRLRLVSGPGGGTRVEAVVPLSRQGALEEEQHGGDPSVELGLLGEAELAEDRVGVLLDRPLGDRQLPGDGEVALTRRHQGEDLELPRRESGEP